MEESIRLFVVLVVWNVFELVNNVPTWQWARKQALEWPLNRVSTVFADICRHLYVQLTSPFNKMRILKLKAQPTNVFFATVNQILGGSSQLPTTTEHCFVVSTTLNDSQRFDYHALGRSRKLGEAANHLIDGSEKRTCRRVEL